MGTGDHFLNITPVAHTLRATINNIDKNFKILRSARQWWHTALIPALCEFESSLWSQFQNSQLCYTEKPCLKKSKNKKNL